MPRRTQLINGVERVYDYFPRWDKEKKYSTSDRDYIGKMVDGVFVPNEKYKLRMALEEAEKKNEVSSPPGSFSRLFHGATHLFDAIGERTGVAGDLKKCFPETYKQILSLAYYLILEDSNPLSRFPKWAKTHSHPFGSDIPSQRSSEIFASIDEDSKQRFFRMQANRRMEKEFLVYDTTSVSSYSKLIKQVKYGHNKDHDPLPQINLLLLYGEESRLPIYYRKLPGNIADVTTVRTLLSEIDFLRSKKVKLVMDKGFYSEKNVNELYRNHSKFLMAIRSSLNWVKEMLDEERTKLTQRACYDSEHEVYGLCRSTTWSYTETMKRSGEKKTGEKRIYLHLFRDERRSVEDRCEFNAMLDGLERELRSGKRVSAHEKLYATYYDVGETPVRGIRLTPKQEAIEEAQKNFGCFALVSNDVKESREALRIYRGKDLIEKAFGNLKERLNLRRTSVSSEENLEGKLFVQFIALTYLSQIDKTMREKSLYKKYTLCELLDELNVIEKFESPGKNPYFGEITGKQRELYACFGVEPPT